MLTFYAVEIPYSASAGSNYSRMYTLGQFRNNLRQIDVKSKSSHWCSGPPVTTLITYTYWGLTLRFKIYCYFFAQSSQNSLVSLMNFQSIVFLASLHLTFFLSFEFGFSLSDSTRLTFHLYLTLQCQKFVFNCHCMLALLKVSHFRYVNAMFVGVKTYFTVQALYSAF